MGLDGGREVTWFGKYLCGGEISSKGLLCTTEEKVQYKGEDVKHKS